MHSNYHKVSTMLHFIQTMSLSAILASGTILCSQNVLACGGGRSCARPAGCAMPACSAPAVSAANAATSQMQMDHSGRAQAGSRTRYQSAYQGPMTQPQYYVPAPQRRTPAWSESQNNYLPKADPRRFSRGI